MAAEQRLHCPGPRYSVVWQLQLVPECKVNVDLQTVQAVDDVQLAQLLIRFEQA